MQRWIKPQRDGQLNLGLGAIGHRLNDRRLAMQEPLHHFLHFLPAF
jgi:hypothetical protein